ncbi:hypothetical protein BD410DRAFT_836514 [Rickenella mellea]|uniref:F-box domain-containing protein n=1 Tax=Rickenella mellea TaxID=50990 RepID=A0A4Y7QHD0_9AGAM|nr:hypothetical protein BD410DRAFT_836514 [Rickenella mellea]
MRKLSAELTDIIIDYLCDDRPSLRSCSLVCRSWLPSSRFHLISTLELDFYSDFEKRFPIISSLDSTIPPYVRHLKLAVCYVWEERLVDCLSMLPTFGALKSISLSFVAWSELTLEAKNSLLDVLRGLKILRLNHIQFDTFEEALEFLSLVPSLECLSLGYTSIKSGVKTASPTISYKLQLKQIAFAPGGDRFTAPLIDWLCLQPTPSVHTLNLTVMSVMQTPSISRYLKVLGPTLQYLGISISPTEYDSYSELKAAACKEIDLAHNPSLRTITFDNLVLYADTPADTPKPDCLWIINILSRITSPFIKMVTLVIYANAAQEISSFNLPALASFFEGGRSVSTMRSTIVRFAIFGNIDKTAAIATITENLHDLNKQSQLVFGGHGFTEQER